MEWVVCDLMIVCDFPHIKNKPLAEPNHTGNVDILNQLKRSIKIPTDSIKLGVFTYING